MLADVTGKTVCLLYAEDASAVGAALLAFKVLGEPESEFSTESSSQTKIEPDAKNHSVYENRFLLFQDLYTALKPTLHRLYELKN